MIEIFGVDQSENKLVSLFIVVSNGKKAYVFIELRLSLLSSNLESNQVLSYLWEIANFDPRKI